MKASVYLRYSDNSESSFKFECDAPDCNAIATLMMVCRGTLRASSAERVIAFDDEGNYLFTYV